MLSRFASLLLASAAVAPLAATLLALSIYAHAPWENTARWAILTGAFFALPLLLFKLAFSRFGTIPFEIRTVKSIDSAGIVQVLGWLIPFAAKPYVDLTAQPVGVLVVAFFLILFLHRSHALHSSPWLAAIGYHSYEVQSQAGSTYLLLSKRRLTPLVGDIQVVQLAEYMILDKERV